MPSNLQRHHYIHKQTIIPSEVHNTLPIGGNTHDDNISTDDGRKLRRHKGNGVICREVDMALEKYSEDVNLMTKY